MHFKPLLSLPLLFSCLASPDSSAWQVVDIELRFRLNLANLGQVETSLVFAPSEVSDPANERLYRPARWGLAQPRNGLFPQGGMDLDASFVLSNQVFHSESFFTSVDGASVLWRFVSEAGVRHEFVLTHPHTHIDPETGDFHAEDIDVFNRSLLPPGVAAPGFLAGSADWIVRLAGTVPELAAANDCLPDFGPSDLELYELGSTAQLLRVPGDRVAFAPAARLRNIGANDVRWEWAIAPATGGPGPLIGPHPFLVMNFYRIRDGRLEPLGHSDAKHAWNSTNEDCACNSGQVMYQGCSDLYGVSNNGNQFYFGPRGEVDPFTGAWNSLGSHFDGVPADNFRHHVQAGHGGFDHRLVVEESALSGSNTSYFVEAWYLSAQDTNSVNNIGHRGVAPVLSGGIWLFPSTNAMARGPALRTWVPVGTFSASARHATLRTPEGALESAVRVKRLPSGRFRYDYAVFNLDHPRGVLSVECPVRDAGAPDHFVYVDADSIATNDWAAVRPAGVVRWNSTGQPLGWGVLRTFSLESDTPPAAGALALGLANPNEPGESLSIPSLVPGGFRLVSFQRDASGLRWESLPGARYRVEQSNGLSPGSWVDASGPLESLGTTLHFAPPTPASDAIFYRVVLDFP